MAHGIGAVLGQAAVTAKSNEIPAVRDLLKRKKTVEVVYLITSDHDADPATLAACTCGHWEIEE